MAENILFKALFWEKSIDTKVQCFLCPRHCLIKNGERGFCNVRENRDGKLYSLVYGYPVALQVDPIEKKPLYEFLSGSKTFSIGTVGCNLDCCFCQNFSLSRGDPGSLSKSSGKYFPPDTIVKLAIQYNCKSIAFTYNEPTVWIEYAIDIARLARLNNLNVVLVSNGYITEEASNVFYPLIDAANIDMKGFSEDFYSDMTHGSLKPVLDSIKYLYSLNKHIELTNLVIPTKNDSNSMINLYLDWVEENLDKNIPLHFSAFHPMHKLKQLPRTSPHILYKIKDIAKNRGFNHIYLGNI